MTDIAVATTIPTPITPLIGREYDLDQVIQMLSSNVRLLTLTGIGGIGKTRLALQIALELEPHFAAGVLFVPLADVRDESQIPFEATRVLGNPAPGIDVAGLVSSLGQDARLIVLDNLEQIPEAGDVLAAMLAAHPLLTILCTSQVSLDIPGEYIYPLQPMSLAKPDASPQLQRSSPSVELFLLRARAANARRTFSDDEVAQISEICAMLDGIPLALELAAARTSILSLTELKERLGNRLDVLTGGSRQVPDRLRTMRNAIGWSYGLLNPDERRIFRYLGVFSGVIQIEAIDHVLSTLNINETALEIADRFVNRSLLRVAPNGGFQMLQTLRMFAAEQCQLEGEDLDAHHAQAAYVVELVERLSHLLTGKEQEEWYRILDIERQNVLSASEWAVEHSPEITLRIIAAIWKELDFLGISHRYIELGLLAAKRDVTANVLVRGLLGVGIMQMNLHDHPDEARSTLNTVLDLSRMHGDRYTETRALNGLGVMELHRGELDASMSFFQMAEEVAKTAQDSRSLNAVRANLASVASEKDDLDLALEQYLLVLQAYENEDNLAMSAVTNCNVGITYQRREELDSARMYLDRAITLARTLDNVPVELFSLRALGDVYADQKEYEKAHSYYEEGVALAQRTNRRANEMELRMADLLIQVKVGNINHAMSGITSTLAISSSDYASDAILAGAAVVAIASQEAGNLQDAASLTGAVVNSPVFNASFPTYLSAPLETIWTSVPDDPNDSLRLAFEAGAGWDLETISANASQFAQEFNAQRGAATVQPEPEPAPPAYSLSPRETEVLAMVAKGLTNAEIAEAMFVSLRTTTTHLTNIFTKLDVKNRSSAVALARESGLLPTS